MRKMLRYLSKHFELILYTSSEAEYAKSAIKSIERDEAFF